MRGLDPRIQRLVGLMRGWVYILASKRNGTLYERLNPDWRDLSEDLHLL